jgi:hypothetical protein
MNLLSFLLIFDLLCRDAHMNKFSVLSRFRFSGGRLKFLEGLLAKFFLPYGFL